MRMEDFKKMDAKGKKIIIDESKSGTSLEVECYSNPKDDKTYQVDMQAMRYRKLSSSDDNIYGEWIKIGSESIADKLRKTTSSILKDTSHVVGSSLESVRDKYEKSEVKVKVDNASYHAKKFLDEKGITDAVNKVSDTVGEHLDTVSGAKILTLVEEKLTIQAKYNDILATKLDEALRRIQELESKMRKQDE